MFPLGHILVGQIQKYPKNKKTNVHLQENSILCKETPLHYLYGENMI